MAELTIEQRRAIAMANARLRLQQQVGTAPAAPEPDMWQKAKPYVMPVAETLGVVGGGIVGGAAGALGSPTLVVNPVSGAMAGAGLGYAGVKELEQLFDTYMSGKKPRESAAEAVSDVTGNVATGAALELGGQALGATIKGAAGLYKGRVDKNAAEFLRKAAGDKYDDVMNAVRQSVESGKNETVGQALVTAGVDATTLQGLGANAEKMLGQRAYDLYKSQEVARQTALKNVTPGKETAEQLRDMASNILYSRARTADKTRVAKIAEEAAEGTAMKGVGGNVPIPSPKTDAIKGLETDPRIIAAVSKVKAVRPDLKDPLASFEGAELVKRAIDTELKSPATTDAFKNYSKSELGDVRNQLIKAIEEFSPLYKEARGAHRRLSAPVNQAEVLNKLATSLEGVGLAERPGAFLNNMNQGLQRVISKATGNPRYQAPEEFFTPQQLATTRGVQNELLRDARMAEQAAAGTAEANAMLKGAQDIVTGPQLLSRTATLISGVSRAIQGKVGKATVDRVNRALLEGRDMLSLMNELPMRERVIVMRELRNFSPELPLGIDATTTPGLRMGIGATNALVTSE